MANKKQFLEKIHTHLFATDKEVAREFTKTEQDMIIRYRAAFTKWLDDWHLSDKEMVSYIQTEYGMSRAVAYNDVANIKMLLGNVKTAGREFQRIRANEMIFKAYHMLDEAETALEVKRAEGMIKAALALVKIHRLNHPDMEQMDWEDIKPAEFEVTGDVSVLGIEPIKNLEEVKAKLRAKYLKVKTKTEDAEFEIVEE